MNKKIDIDEENRKNIIKKLFFLLFILLIFAFLFNAIKLIKKPTETARVKADVLLMEENAERIYYKRRNSNSR